MLEIYGDNFEGNEDDKKERNKKSMLKIDFFHYPQGESLYWKLDLENSKCRIGKVNLEKECY